MKFAEISKAVGAKWKETSEEDKKVIQTGVGILWWRAQVYKILFTMISENVVPTDC